LRFHQLARFPPNPPTHSYTYKSWIAYKRNAAPKPVIMVFPNYAGLKDFDKDQAMFLAKLGWVVI
jgi:dienelactone hydrolase